MVRKAIKGKNKGIQNKTKITIILSTLIIIFFGISVLYFYYYSFFDALEITTPYLEKLKYGKNAPNFEAVYLNGSEFNLQSLKDKFILLNFWISSCPYCLEEMPVLELIYKENRDKLVIIGINIGERVSKAEFFVDYLNITYPIAMDKDDEVQKAYGIIYKPSTVFISKSGKLIKKISGPMDINLLRYRLNQYIGEDYSKERNSANFDLSNSVLPFGDIINACEKDCLRYLYFPKFADAADAQEFLSDDDLVIGINLGSTAKAYPVAILNWHEVINDEIGGTPVLVTYSPFGDLAKVYKRKVNGEEIVFGVSGKVYENNPLLYDTKTNSLWTQFDGRSIAGTLVNKSLNEINNHVMKFGDWRRLNPNGLVMTKDTGYLINYNRYPYGKYKSNRRLFFPTSFNVYLGHPKPIVYSLCIGKECKSYAEKVIKEKNLITDFILDTNIMVIYDDEKGHISAYNVSDDKELVLTRSYWFLWKSFHPDSILIK